ncbi:MAG: dual specificity protein phosphatase [Phototrophicaceae bacterium]
MYKIREWLYVSNFASASIPSTIQKLGIQGMLQLYQPIDNPAIDCKFIGLQDGIPITVPQLQAGIAFIHDQRKNKHRILSTCGAGISRSVTMAIVALKEVEHLSLFDAYRAVYQRHAKAMPDHVHWQSIAHYYGEDDDFWEIWGDITLLDGG